MCTILISRTGGFEVHVNEISSPVDDGFLYKVMETNFICDSQKKAIKNARTFLKRKRKFMVKTPDETKIKRVRTKQVKVKRRRTK